MFAMRLLFKLAFFSNLAITSLLFKTGLLAAIAFSKVFSWALILRLISLNSVSLDTDGLGLLAGILALFQVLSFFEIEVFFADFTLSFFIFNLFFFSFFGFSVTFVFSGSFAFFNFFFIVIA